MATPLSIQFASDCAFAASTSYRFIEEEETVQDTKTMTLSTIDGKRIWDPNPSSRDQFSSSHFKNYFNVNQGFGDCFVFGGGSTWAGKSSMGFVALGTGQRANQALIAFRGSEFNNTASWKAIRRDILIDGAFLPGSSPKGWAVHGGFAKVFKSCLPEIEEIFRRLPYIHTVHCAGHSMGGALATLTAEYFIDNGPTPYLYSFGAPRVGMFSHAAYMHAKMSSRMFRYYFQGDPVTWMPMFPYVHIPGKRLINTGGFGNHNGYSDTKNLIVAAGGPALKKDQRAEVELLIGQGESVGGGYGLESRGFRYFMKALNKILYLIGAGIGISLFAVPTVIDQVVATLSWAVTRGQQEKPLIIRWMQGAFNMIGKLLKCVTIDLVKNLRYLLNLMLTQLRLNTERELSVVDQSAQRGRQVIVRNPRPNAM